MKDFDLIIPWRQPFGGAHLYERVISMDDFWRRFEEDFSGYRGPHHPSALAKGLGQGLAMESGYDVADGCWDEDWNFELPEPQSPHQTCELVFSIFGNTQLASFCFTLATFL